MTDFLLFLATVIGFATVALLVTLPLGAKVAVSRAERVAGADLGEGNFIAKWFEMARQADRLDSEHPTHADLEQVQDHILELEEELTSVKKSLDAALAQQPYPAGFSPLEEEGATFGWMGRERTPPT